MELTGEFRGRFEANTGLGFREGANDAYYLHRIRGHLLLKPTSWFRIRLTGQDSEAPARREPVPANISDGFDLFQAYVEIGDSKKSPWSARIGRQEMRFDNEHFVGAANWGNTGRSYDAVKLIYDTTGYHAEAWGSTVVRQLQGEVNRITRTQQLHGIHFDAKKWLPKSTVSFYHYIKIHPAEANESATALARSRVHTSGFGLKGTLPRRFDYTAETAIQNGRSGGEPLSAWAGRYILGQSPWRSKFNPRLYAVYSYSSPDRNPTDRRRNTLDQLYPTNHSPFGLGDRISWKNMHEAAGGVQWRPYKNVRLQHEYHSFWLASRRDSFYDFGQRRVVLMPGATSNHLYHEWDTQAFWDINSHVQIVLGYAHLFAGGFVRQATAGSGVSVPYAQWLYRF
ncbi:MAG: alginate export family protein [Bryobacteraceae bacterium]